MAEKEKEKKLGMQALFSKVYRANLSMADFFQ